MKTSLLECSLRGVTFLGTVSWLFGIALTIHAQTAARPPLNVKVDEAPAADGAKTTISFAPIAKKVAPSVVQIFVKANPENQPSNSDLDKLRRFFGNRLFGLNPGR